MSWTEREPPQASLTCGRLTPGLGFNIQTLTLSCPSQFPPLEPCTAPRHTSAALPVSNLVTEFLMTQPQSPSPWIQIVALVFFSNPLLGPQIPERNSKTFVIGIAKIFGKSLPLLPQLLPQTPKWLPQGLLS